MEDLVRPPIARRSLGAILERTYRGRRILVTGHNGFVGSWMSMMLAASGAEVVGLSLEARDGELASLVDLDDMVISVEGDVRDPAIVASVMRRHRPEVVFHLAAQALVIPSFEDPIATFATNVMGTAHVLEAIRHEPSVRAGVIVTSDKCYATSATAQVETDPLGGDDPYSASKGAAEIVTHAFRSTLIAHDGAGIASARAGNIMGGGDFSGYRIIPDCVRALRSGEPIRLRNPSAVRPWQHVLDAIAGYLRLGGALLDDPALYAAPWNFGPDASSPATVADLVAIFLDRWCWLTGLEVEGAVHESSSTLPERSSLTLSSAKALEHLGWRPRLDLHDTVEWSADWYHATTVAPSQAAAVTSAQIERYLDLEEQSPERSARALALR